MRRESDTPAIIASDVKGRTTGGDDSGGSTATTPGGARQVIRITGAPVNQIVGLERQGELRRIRLPEEDGSGGAQASHNRGIFGRDKGGSSLGGTLRR